VVAQRGLSHAPRGGQGFGKLLPFPGDFFSMVSDEIYKPHDRLLSGQSSEVWGNGRLLRLDSFP
jgi:hypothetical protein